MCLPTASHSLPSSPRPLFFHSRLNAQFIHGCAVLLPEDVQAQPYWIDDITLKDSIEASGAGGILDRSLGANQHYQHLLPHDDQGNPRIPRKTPSQQQLLLAGGVPSDTLGQGQGQGHGQGQGQGQGQELEVEAYGFGWAGPENGCWGASDCFGDTCDFALAWRAPRITAQKVEPKLFFANERTFIKWLHMAVILTSISIGILAFSASDSQSHVYAVILLPVSLLFVLYAIVTYVWRSRLIRTRSSDRWDDPVGPVVLTVLLIIALVIQYLLKVKEVMAEWGAGAGAVVAQNPVVPVVPAVP